MAFDQGKPAASAPLASADMRNNFTHLKTAISKEHAWDDANPASTTHRLDQINTTVASSTQRDIASGYDYTTGSGNATIAINHTVKGITANNYTLQSLLQELVNRSHRHEVEQHLLNCNCNCSDGGSCCFIAGTMVLMADWTWKAIEQIKAGDKVIGIDGKVNTVLVPYSVKLGNQRSIIRFCDNSLFWSAEHLLWVKSPDGTEYWGTHDFNQYLREKEGVYEIEDKVFHYAGLTKKEPLVVTNGFSYGHLSGWLDKHVVIDRSFGEDTLLYSMVVNGSHSCIVNGYFAAGFVDDTDFDYVNWDFLIGKAEKWFAAM